MPSVKDRTRWLTLEDANEAAKDAWMEKQAETKPSQDGRANVKTTAVGDLSIEVEVSVVEVLQDKRSDKKLKLICNFLCHSAPPGRPGLDDDRGRDEKVGRDARFLTPFQDTGQGPTRGMTM